MRRTIGSTCAVDTAPRRSMVSISAAAAFLVRPNVRTSFISYSENQLLAISY
jgi:hypothetical protein